MEQMQFLSLILGGSFASGINVYMTVATLGIAHRFHWITLPGEMEVFASIWIILLAIVMYAIEFCADKIPVVDSTWDAIHTFIRPAGGIALGYLAVGPEAGPIVQTGTALLTGTISLQAHTTKAATRAAINTSPEPITNSIASITEDTSVAILMFLIVKHPVIATVVAVGLIIGAFVILKMLFKFVKKIFSPKRDRIETPDGSINPQS